MVFLVIILALSIFSAYYMNKLSNETGAILKENYLSVVYAREISGSLTDINQEITKGFLTNKRSDSLFIKQEFSIIHKSLESEKNNITEPGEGKLVSDLESEINEYHVSVAEFSKSPQPASNLLNLQKKFGVLYQQLLQLSQMNGKAIEVKTNDTKVSSQDAVTQMSILATLCFIIALFYSYSFSSYSNERFSQLYNGIKEMVSGNFMNRLDLEGTDKFYEISLVFNQMAEQLNENRQKMALTLETDLERAYALSEIQELKSVLLRIKNIEEQAEVLIAKLEEEK